ncbi:MAG: hypothetical protein QM728_05100 [Gordonia sp. (in: high G+C Gram-positive bacteria)]|uniref:hypothetical protein n=1 Tax=Gordonia sp. (in: high G+C Gram-positive bacteria) TaxID=84139 RepID=UPI0039E6C6CD
MAIAELITTGSVNLGGRDVTSSDTTTLLTATERTVEIVAPASLGVLGELSVSVPTEALRALLAELDGAAN